MLRTDSHPSETELGPYQIVLRCAPVESAKSVVDETGLDEEQSRMRQNTLLLLFLSVICLPGQSPGQALASPVTATRQTPSDEHAGHMGMSVGYVPRDVLETPYGQKSQTL